MSEIIIKEHWFDENTLQWFEDAIDQWLPTRIISESISDGISFSDVIVCNATAYVGTYYMTDYWYNFNNGQWFSNDEDQWLPIDRYDPRYVDGLILSEESIGLNVKSLYSINTKDRTYYFDTDDITTYFITNER